jgi:hypothetical protein
MFSIPVSTFNTDGHGFLTQRRKEARAQRPQRFCNSPISANWFLPQKGTKPRHGFHELTQMGKRERKNFFNR